MNILSCWRLNPVSAGLLFLGALAPACSQSGPPTSRSAPSELRPFTIQCGQDSVVVRGPDSTRLTTDVLAYASTEPGFIVPDSLREFGTKYIKLGVMRRIPEEIKWAADHNGVPLFLEPGADTGKAPPVLYLLVEPPCTLQPYADITTVHIQDRDQPTFASDPLPAYRAVLKHLRTSEATIGTSPIVLDKAGVVGWSTRHGQEHPDSVLRALIAGGSVDAVCDSRSEPGCASPVPPVLVRLGRVREHPENVYVTVVAEDRPPGQTLGEQIDSMPDSARAPTDFEVDVKIERGCPAGGTGGCTPGRLRYMYFLREEASGELRVVTRWRLDAF